MARLGNLRIREAARVDDVLSAPPENIERFVAAAAYEIHKTLGYALPASIYRECLAEELRNKGFFIEKDAPFPIEYKSSVIEGALKADLVVDNSVIVLVRAEPKQDHHRGEIGAFLKSSGKPLGFLINFRLPDIRQGIMKASVQKGSVRDSFEKPTDTANLN